MYWGCLGFRQVFDSKSSPDFVAVNVFGQLHIVRGMGMNHSCFMKERREFRIAPLIDEEAHCIREAIRVSEQNVRNYQSAKTEIDQVPNRKTRHRTDPVAEPSRYGSDWAFRQQQVGDGKRGESDPVPWSSAFQLFPSRKLLAMTIAGGLGSGSGISERIENPDINPGANRVASGNRTWMINGTDEKDWLSRRNSQWERPLAWILTGVEQWGQILE
jgi:hypothetical protein